MSRGLLIRLLTCIFVVGVFLLFYLNQQIELTSLRLEIPAVQKELKSIQEENIRLQYEIDEFESPANLIQLSRKPEFSYLRHPLNKEIIIVPNKEDK